MKSESTGPILTTVFVDYDNIYMSLRRKSEEAAKRFAKDTALWLREIESGRLITGTNGASFEQPRRIVMSRCYGNPVPRRNSGDNSTDMNSFPFIRHHFLRAGFEVVDCPPLTAQLKNSADIRMVMDVRDVLNHETRFEEFIILSGDADFTPVLHRLRAHARRTVVFANDHTAQPYTAISDGEVREADLISLLLEGRIGESESKAELKAPLTSADLATMRKEIVAEVVSIVKSAPQPVPLEALADRAVRSLGHDRTVGSGWGGAGSFRDLLAKGLPGDVKLSDQPPYFAIDLARQGGREIEARPELRERRPELPRAEAPSYETRAPLPSPSAGQMRPEAHREVRVPLSAEAPMVSPPMAQSRAEPARSDLSSGRYDHRSLPPSLNLDQAAAPAPNYGVPPQASRMPTQGVPDYGAPAARPSAQMQAPPSYGQASQAMPPQRQPQAPSYAAQPAAPSAPQAPAPRGADVASQLQQSIARIHEACQAPPLSPPEYRVLFEVMAEEINANNLSGQQTLINIAQRALDMGLEVKRDDVRFVLEVVSEADPWFEQGASATLFASRFRNFVVARCRSQGLQLSSDELDLVDAWFGGGAPQQAQRAAAPPQAPAYKQAPVQQGYGAPQASGAPPRSPQVDPRWDDPRYGAPPQSPAQQAPAQSEYGANLDDEFPRIVRSRLRG